MRNIEIKIGGLAPPIAKQIELQGLYFETETHKNLAEKFYKSIMALKVHGIMTSTEVNRISQRYIKWLSNHVYELVITPPEERKI